MVTFLLAIDSAPAQNCRFLHSCAAKGTSESLFFLADSGTPKETPLPFLRCIRLDYSLFMRGFRLFFQAQMPQRPAQNVRQSVIAPAANAAARFARHPGENAAKAEGNAALEIMHHVLFYPQLVARRLRLTFGCLAL